MAEAMMNSSTDAHARKFAFETVFSAEGEVLRDASGFRSQFSAEEVEQARAEAFEAGRKQGEGAVAAALAALSQSMAALIARYDEEARQLRTEAVELAQAAARKAADTALDAFGRERIVDALTQALENLRGAPRLLVRIAPTLVGSLKSRLEDAAQLAGFDCALIVRADEAIAEGDVALEWAEGAIIHDRAEAFARIEDVVRAALQNEDMELIE
jgi:flagellar assembly protein FliH